MKRMKLEYKRMKVEGIMENKNLEEKFNFEEEEIVEVKTSEEDIAKAQALKASARKTLASPLMLVLAILMSAFAILNLVYNIIDAIGVKDQFNITFLMITVSSLLPIILAASLWIIWIKAKKAAEDLALGFKMARVGVLIEYLCRWFALIFAFLVFLGGCACTNIAPSSGTEAVATTSNAVYILLMLVILVIATIISVFYMYIQRFIDNAKSFVNDGTGKLESTTTIAVLFYIAAGVSIVSAILTFGPMESILAKFSSMDASFGKIMGSLIDSGNIVLPISQLVLAAVFVLAGVIIQLFVKKNK